MVICRSNKRANIFNRGIREKIYNREEGLSAGDYLMVVKNNYFWIDDPVVLDFIANGDIVEVMKIFKYEERYGYRFADIKIRFIDYPEITARVKIMLDTLFIESAALPQEKNKELFYKVLEEYEDIKSKKKRFDETRLDPYYNALQVKFAYAITCHKSQGGQWKAVYIDQGYLTDNLINKEYLRWLYTAFTRATDKLFLINFSDKFFE